MEVPLNAQYIRNLMMGTHGIFDHIVHFYHLCALDWVDIISALKADPKAAADLAEKLSSWPKNSRHEMKAAQDRIKALVGSGQLGIYASGYWGHSAMKLPPEVNLLATAHYLQALEYQRKINKAVSILGSKTPHVQNLAVGGVANAINPDSQSALNMERLYYVKTLIDEIGDFIKNVYMVDACAVAAIYADWTTIGAGVTDYLCVPDMPLDTKGTKFELPGGYIPGGDVSKFKPIKSFNDDLFEKSIKESIKHSYYQGDWNRHPWEEETVPNLTEYDTNGKYSWVKAPTFEGKPAQVGPLANVLNMFAAGHKPTVKYTTKTLDTVNAVLSMLGSSTRVSVNSLHSTIGRIAARAIRCAVLHDACVSQWQALIDNIGKGDTSTFNQPVFPKGEQRGFGFHEAPRGMLSHWVVIENGKIKNYQCVVPSTWNAAPRNSDDVKGPYEAALIGTPVADPEKPLEVLRTIHSFDPCLACAIHMVNPNKKEIVKVQAF